MLFRVNRQFVYARILFGVVCNTVLEIGCGTGQSTLSLLEAGHSVVAVDQNPYCIETAKKLIEKAGYTIKESANDLTSKSVCFYECDVTEPTFNTTILANLSIDVVICWNIGTYWDKKKNGKQRS